MMMMMMDTIDFCHIAHWFENNYFKNTCAICL